MMIDLPLFLAQLSDEGPRWSSLFYLLILVVFPLVNWIKDKFVERAAKKTQLTAEPDPAHRPTTPPDRRPVAPGLLIAKLLDMPEELGFQIEPPQVPGSTAPAPPPMARPVEPAPTAQPTAPRPAPRPPPTPVTPDQKQAGTLTGIRAVSVSVDLRAAAPDVDLHSADPSVDIHQADPADVIHEAEVALVAETTDLPAASLLRGPALMGRKLTPAEMRRAVAVREVLDLPVGLRGPGGRVGPDRL